MKARVRQLWWIFLLFAALPWAWPQERAALPGLPRFARVADGLYRSGQPSETGFQYLAQLGVRTVIDLRGPGERAARERALVESLGMHYVNIPLSGWRPPRDEAVLHVLMLLADPAARPVLVHCRRGADRTGVIIALYRILYEGWDPERAYREMRAFGFRWYLRGMKRYVWEAPERLRTLMAVRTLHP
ncbi:MAG: tyrosine-protein phosphatase [Blastocatellia bacterium]|nr:tyrosine-protein phosphatase [Blastocatellia bacterium]MCX7751893.1 tyrosine-protein phosphatase [Blastocatellia bacterium]MDW8166999.1 tyrosine-protein phosphatase [Acidobacteriota bacterium]MDW8257103.1 tyrosine-protein phosphatase [Acidobacteriota bacterium]